MKIDLNNLDSDFSENLDYLITKYGEDFAKLNGMSKNNLNFTGFIDNFIDSKSKVVDISINPNANSDTKDVTSLIHNMTEPHCKLLAMNKIFYELKKKYGLDQAKKWLEGEWIGETYLHDFPTATFVPYCYAVDLDQLVEKGLFFINKFKTSPAKHLTTFNDHCLEYIGWLSNRQSGAVGLPSYLIYSYWYWKNDIANDFYLKDPEYYRRQCFQKFIYDCNQPYLRVIQSAFTNITIMDRNYIEELFGGRVYPDGTFVIDCVDEIIEHQKVFVEVVKETRKHMMATFPVITYSLLYRDGKFEDEEFAKWCCQENMDWCDGNFYLGSDVTSLSSCCFDGKQMCLSRSSNGINYMTFKELYEASYNEHKRNFTVFHNGSWVNGKVIRLSKRNLYKICTSNKKEVYVTDNHIFPTISGDKLVKDLTTKDYLMFNTRILDSFPEKDNHLTYNQGYLIGMYLGDGSKTKSGVITLSLNYQKYNDSVGILSSLTDKVKLNKTYNNVFPIAIKDNKIYDFISQYVKGNYSFEKELNMNCLLQSKEFRQGILDGYYLTDGGNSNRIYSTSEKLIYQIECLLTSLGLNSNIDVSDRTDEPCIIRGEVFNHNYPLYCIRWYNSKNKRTMGTDFKVVNNSEFFKIVSIEKYDSDSEYVYCFEIKNQEEPYFTLPNGIITHNCRLVNNLTDVHKKKNLGFINSIGGTSLSIGSVKVNTINLRRVALDSKGDKDQFMRLLSERVDTTVKTLDVIRHIIKRNIEKGLLPNYTYELLKLENQYNTIGITAMYECVREFGGIGEDKLGNKFYTDDGLNLAEEILDKITELKESYDFDYSINIEAVPAENANVKLRIKDDLIYPDAHNENIYSNQWIPLQETCTIQEKVKLGSILDKKCGGGQISHINVNGNFNNFDQAWKILNYLGKSGVIYSCFNKKISVCKNEHGYIGDGCCPTCGEPKFDEFTRVVGFLTPSKSYSKERKEEFNNRRWYSVKEIENVDN